MINWEQIDKEILGWMSYDEAKCLFDSAINCPLNRVLEFGCFVGKSTSVLASAMKQRNGLVMTFDLFPKGSKFWDAKGTLVGDTYIEMWQNMVKLGLDNYVISIKGNTRDTVPMVEGKFGMVFIDGGHTTEYIMPQAKYAWEHTLKGGYIIFHDYVNKEWGDVKICVDELVKEWNVTPTFVGTMAVIKR